MPPAFGPSRNHSTVKEANIPSPGNLDGCRNFITQCQLISQDQPVLFGHDAQKWTDVVNLLDAPPLNQFNALREQGYTAAQSFRHFLAELRRITALSLRVDHWHLRLAAGEGRCDGRVEVYHSGVWGRVTDDLWDFKDADVVCRQLKCGSAVNVYNHGKYGIGKGPVIMSNVSCIGDLRLVAGFDNCSGRIEVFFSGTWGTVCDDSWDRHDAAVVCRQLNCGDPVLASGGMLFPLGNGTILMDEVKCKGSENFLSDCQFSILHRHDCGHKETVGVICSDHQSHIPTFTNLRAFIYAIPFILGSLLVIVSLYLIKSQRRQFQNGDKKSRPSAHKLAEPFYEEIAIQETGPGVGDFQSISSAEKLEYCLVGDLHGDQNEDMEESPLPLDENFGEELDDIE
ncbi:neurotrypsin-like [Mobula birostris]|uniref:neurotrypsin-like n=1 Tax=Mobula birostris TaxID=1983395 RepID=UPI003B2894B9